MSKKIDARSQEIMRVVLRDGSISIDGLVKKIGTSATNIRRDLTRLERRGLVSRARGRAMVPDAQFYETFQHDISMQVQQRHFVEEKRRIGLAASELIEEWETVGLTSGTTTTQIGRALRHRQNISVVTNALNIAMELSHHLTIKTTLTSGALAKSCRFSLVADAAVNFLNDVYLDKVFVGAASFDLEHGATTLDSEEAKVARAMVRHARQVIIVADSSKIGRVNPEDLCPLSSVRVLVTDSGLAQNILEAIKAKGIHVLLA